MDKKIPYFMKLSEPICKTMQKEANAGKRRERKAFVAFLTLFTSQKAVANEVLTIKNQFENSFCNHVHLR